MSKDTKCMFCLCLKNGLNIRILKICMLKETFPLRHFPFVGLNNYLKTLPEEGFFYFDIQQNKIEYLIDHLDWREFFYDIKTQSSKETM